MKQEKHTNRPNLLRVAAAISECQNLNKVLETLMLVLEGSVNNTANGN